jgi:predicted acyltransferase
MEVREAPHARRPDEDTADVMESTSAPPASPRTRRALALDALRGFAILTMALSGYIPWHVLPAWMYHAQMPPPANAFDPTVPGITWVDLVFPFFLFSMGAAFPLALSRRIERQGQPWRVVGQVARRGVALGFFAIYIQHVYPHVLDPGGGKTSFGLGLLGFLLLFPVLTRCPATWKPWAVWSVRGVGWAAVIAFLLLLRYPGDPPDDTFSLHRSNIIMVVLANTAVFGSLIWLATPGRWLFRFAILGLLLAMRLAHEQPGWVQCVWDYSPIPWMYHFRYLQYLFVILPGTIVGDLLLAWMKTPRSKTSQTDRWARWRIGSLAGLGVAALGVALVGLRPGPVEALRPLYVTCTTLTAVVLSVIGAILVQRPSTGTERLLRQLVVWGFAWLLLGLAFDAYEGGIKKDHATMSYYFVTTGLATLLLMSFTIVIDVFGHRGWLGLLIAPGQNPMIAYLGIQCLVRPFLVLTGLGPVLERLTPGPWPGVGRGVIMTLLLALAVSGFTRLRIFWRT